MTEPQEPLYGEWTNVKDELPQEPVVCMVYMDDGQITLGIYKSGVGTKLQGYVTHWKPLSEG